MNLPVWLTIWRKETGGREETGSRGGHWRPGIPFPPHPEQWIHQLKRTSERSALFYCSYPSLKMPRC